MTMAKAHVELDFLGLQNDTTSSGNVTPRPPQPRLDRRRSFCGISKINPEIVKSVLANSGAKPENGFNSPSVPATPTPTHPNLLPEFPVFKPLPFNRPGSYEKAPDTDTAPMTIFYQGTVSVFDLPKEKAENLMKFAMEKGISAKTDGEGEEASFNAQNEDILEGLNDGDLPIKRKMSLQRFFEKRKERLISVSPYPTDHVLQTHKKTSV